MNAKEARQNSIESEYKIIMENISKETATGGYYIYANGPLFAEVLSRLKDSGFKIGKILFISQIKISW